MVSVARALGGAGNTTADFVLGQPNFSSNTGNNGGITATSLNGSLGVAVDAFGRVYVADRTNYRVLVFNNLADTVADMVFGQPNFTSNTINNGGVSATSLSGSGGVGGIAVDVAGQVYVVDCGNNRVLVFSDPFATNDTTMPVSEIVTPIGTTVTVTPPLATTESFVQINLPQITTITTGVLKTASDSVGTNASYTCTSSLLNPGDSLAIPIWTNQGTGKLFLGTRSDTASLKSNGLPAGISNDDTGKQAFGATVIMTEFSDSTGRFLGDSKTRTNIGDSFAYTLRYFLSEKTAKLYRALGFDTAAGSMELVSVCENACLRDKELREDCGMTKVGIVCKSSFHKHAFTQTDTVKESSASPRRSPRRRGVRGRIFWRPSQGSHRRESGSMS